MKRKSQILAAISTLLLTGATLFAQGVAEAEKPLANFGITPPQGGVIKGWAPAVIKVGAETQMTEGPFGAKAIKFNGTDAAVATMDYGTMADRMKNAECITLTLAIRLDSMPGNGVKPGFGLQLDGGKLSFTNGTFKITASTPLTTDKWYQLTISCSDSMVKLYLDGKFNTLLPIKNPGRVADWFNPGGKFGKFNGAMASIQIWDRALTEKEICRIPTDTRGLDILINDIEIAQKMILTEPIKPYLLATIEQINKVKNTRMTTVQAQERAASMGMIALKLARAEVIFRETSLKQAPFAMFQVQTTSRQMRSPEKFPEDPQYTADLRVAAAIGETEPAAFLIYSYKELPDFTITVSALKNESGAELPASIIDRKLVHYAPRNGWNSVYYSNIKQFVPDLLVNSESTVTYSVNGKIKLPAGSKMPKADAAEIQPVTVVPNQAKHFWYTFKVPENAKPGLYKGTATAKSGGQVIGTFPVYLRVYPFKLPDPKTNYDRSRSFLTLLVGETDFKSAGEARHKKNLLNALAHGINRPVIQASAANDFAKDLAIRKSLGMDLKGSIVALFPDNGTLMTSPDKAHAFPSGMDPMAEADKMLAAFKAAAGHTDFYFYGATSPLLGSDKAAEKMWLDLVKKGAKIITTGESEAAYSLPTLDLFHARAYSPDYLQAEKWHAMKGRLISCGKQLVVHNPDTMRRFFGVTLYRRNYDGFFLASFSNNPDAWTQDRTGVYHRQNLSYPTLNGDPINTIAYEALREAIDDIRYITLMRMLIDEAFASGNQDAIYYAKKAVSTFELHNTGRMNLDLMRMEVVDHIFNLLEILGKDVK